MVLPGGSHRASPPKSSASVSYKKDKKGGRQTTPRDYEFTRNSDGVFRLAIREEHAASDTEEVAPRAETTTGSIRGLSDSGVGNSRNDSGESEGSKVTGPEVFKCEVARGLRNVDQIRRRVRDD